MTGDPRTAAVPAMVNAHSHAFQRDLRGRAERPAPDAARDDFWSWRDAMYRLAGSLDPASMSEVAGRAYEEMAASGYGAVGEFHYVHHRPDGRPYDDANALAIAVAEAGVAAGLMVVMLPAAYHRAGWDGGDLPAGRGPAAVLRSDGRGLPRARGRAPRLGGRAPRVHVGVAAHSVRAVPAEWLGAIAGYADRHGLVRHVHAAEQPREIEECAARARLQPDRAAAGPTGFLGERTSVVHGIHVSDRDVDLLAASGTLVVSCPTTEGNLGDGRPPALAYRAAGVRLALGSDSQVRIDPFEEVRELESGARREGLTRRALLPPDGDLWGELARNGRASLGLEEGEVGQVEINLDHPDLRGVPEAELMPALATCASAGVVLR